MEDRLVELTPFEIAKKLAKRGKSGDEIAYYLFHNLNVSGGELYEALVLECGADLSYEEAAIALRDGLWWSVSDIAYAVYDFWKGGARRDTGDAIIETWKILTRAGIMPLNELSDEEDEDE